jgi:hypothetical protein
MNSSLQSLINLKCIKDYVTAHDHPPCMKHVNVVNRDGKRGDLIKAFAHLVSIQCIIA